MFSHKNHSRIAICALALLPLGLMQGCATSDVSILKAQSSGSNGAPPELTSASTSTKVSDAITYIDSKIERIEAMKLEYGRIGRGARAGTFLGTLGVGVAAMTGMHPDAALGFAGVTGTSMQLGSLSATELSRQNCREAQEALICLRSLGLPMQSGFTYLGSALDGSNGAKSTFDEGKRLLGELDATSAQRPHLEKKLNNLELALAKIQKLRVMENTAANALHTNATNVLFKLEKSLDSLQPSIGTFQISAAAVVSQVRAAGGTALPTASKPAPDVKPPTDLSARVAALAQPTTDAESKKQAEKLKKEADAKRLSDLIDVHFDNISQAILLLGEASGINEQTSEACKGKLTAVIPTMAVNPSETKVLAKGEDQAFVTSGGTGIHTGSFINTVPPSDLLVVVPSFRPNGTVFTFKQLKASDKSEDVTYTFQVADSAAVPQVVDIKVTVKKK